MDEILKGIALQNPYSYQEVKRVYDICKSYDKTIKCLKEATSYCIDPCCWAMQCNSAMRDFCYLDFAHFSRISHKK